MQKHIVALDVSAIRVNTFRFTQTRSLFGHRGRFISRVYFRWESSRRTSFEIHEQRFFSIETARAQKLRTIPMQIAKLSLHSSLTLLLRVALTFIDSLFFPFFSLSPSFSFSPPFFSTSQRFFFIFPMDFSLFPS